MGPQRGESESLGTPPTNEPQIFKDSLPCTGPGPWNMGILHAHLFGEWISSRLEQPPASGLELGAGNGNQPLTASARAEVFGPIPLQLTVWSNLILKASGAHLSRASPGKCLTLHALHRAFLLKAPRGSEPRSSDAQVHSVSP